MPSSPSPFPRAAAVLLCAASAAVAACATAPSTPATPTREPIILTPAPTESIPPDERPRPAFVHADSGLVRVVHLNQAAKLLRLPTGRVVPQLDTSFHAGVAGILARTPTGTFAINVDSTAAAAWADSAAALAAPAPAAAADGRAATVSLSGVMLQRVSTPTALRLLRLGVPAGDSLPAYQLDATNGAWGGRLRLEPAAARSLFAALRGTVAPMPNDPSEPLIERQVDVPARRLGGPDPVYPSEVSRVNVNGDIYLDFVVGVDGHAEPGSLMLSGDPEPLLAAAVRESVLQSRFQPATRGGVAVRQVVHQAYAFRMR